MVALGGERASGVDDGRTLVESDASPPPPLSTPTAGQGRTQEWHRGSSPSRSRRSSRNSASRRSSSPRSARLLLPAPPRPPPSPLTLACARPDAAKVPLEAGEAGTRPQEARRGSRGREAARTRGETQPGPTRAEGAPRGEGPALRQLLERERGGARAAVPARRSAGRGGRRTRAVRRLPRRSPRAELRIRTGRPPPATTRWPGRRLRGCARTRARQGRIGLPRRTPSSSSSCCRSASQCPEWTSRRRWWCKTVPSRRPGRRPLGCRLLLDVVSVQGGARPVVRSPGAGARQSLDRRARSEG